jgi:hypothetical protein
MFIVPADKLAIRAPDNLARPGEIPTLIVVGMSWFIDARDKVPSQGFLVLVNHSCTVTALSKQFIFCRLGGIVRQRPNLYKKGPPT